MLYADFQGKQLPLLGFGAMRLPVDENKAVDQAQLEAMVDYAMAHGVNYFDTACPYHGGTSEIAVGKALKKYPRETWYLADKFPGHQISDGYDPAACFEEQLEKCGVEYFDFYLLHNVYEKSIETYLDPKWNIIPYFLEQKRLGRIKHLGFSTHGGVELMEKFLNICGKDMEFCQIQLNYLDWTLQDARAKVELLKKWDIPVWVMEPVRGGKLCRLPAQDEEVLRALRPDEGIPAWGFRFLQSIPTVKMVLSGMSNMEQMQDNVKTFEERRNLSQKELDALLEVAEHLKDSVPCTACRYCTPHCPRGLDIPMLLNAYNELKVERSMNVVMRMEALPVGKRPSDCVGCGLCARMCPQNINIPAELKNLVKILEEMPSWADICAERAAAQERLRAQRK